jgi:hypothetical protein
MARAQIIVFYKDGTHDIAESNNTSIDLTHPSNANIVRVFVANSKTDARIAAEVFGNEFVPDTKPQGEAVLPQAPAPVDAAALGDKFDGGEPEAAGGQA